MRCGVRLGSLVAVLAVLLAFGILLSTQVAAAPPECFSNPCPTAPLCSWETGYEYCNAFLVDEWCPDNWKGFCGCTSGSSDCIDPTSGLPVPIWNPQGCACECDFPLTVCDDDCLAPEGVSCTTSADCCSGLSCLGPSGSKTCQSAGTCPDGNVDPGEECDDNNANNNDDCKNDCTLNVCMDGVLKTSGSAPLEECDDGNSLTADACTNSCTIAFCGDDVWHNTAPYPPPQEECDGSDLRGRDCEWIVGAGSTGTLSCYDNTSFTKCMWDTSGCTPVGGGGKMYVGSGDWSSASVDQTFASNACGTEANYVSNCQPSETVCDDQGVDRGFGECHNIDQIYAPDTTAAGSGPSRSAYFSCSASMWGYYFEGPWGQFCCGKDPVTGAFSFYSGIAHPNCVVDLCGDGTRQGTEECDGLDLGGNQCSDLLVCGPGNNEACTAGTLQCDSDCTYNVGLCSICPDGYCDAGENFGNCPGDCGELCSGGIDEDGDGATDCFDEDSCCTDPICEGTYPLTGMCCPSGEERNVYNDSANAWSSALTSIAQTDICCNPQTSCAVDSTYTPPCANIGDTAGSIMCGKIGALAGRYYCNGAHEGDQFPGSPGKYCCHDGVNYVWQNSACTGPPDPCDGVSACIDGDTCCPAGCTVATDSDCSDPCAGVSACIDGDTCCPAGCNGLNDDDCACTVVGQVCGSSVWCSGIQQCFSTSRYDTNCNCVAGPPSCSACTSSVECYDPACVGNLCTTTPSSTGTGCSGGACDGAGTCTDCDQDSDGYTREDVAYCVPVPRNDCRDDRDDIHPDAERGYCTDGTENDCPGDTGYGEVDYGGFPRGDWQCPVGVTNAVASGDADTVASCHNDIIVTCTIAPDAAAGVRSIGAELQSQTGGPAGACNWIFGSWSGNTVKFECDPSAILDDTYRARCWVDDTVSYPIPGQEEFVSGTTTDVFCRRTVQGAVSNTLGDKLNDVTMEILNEPSLPQVLTGSGILPDGEYRIPGVFVGWRNVSASGLDGYYGAIIHRLVDTQPEVVNFVLDAWQCNDDCSFGETGRCDMYGCVGDGGCVLTGIDPADDAAFRQLCDGAMVGSQRDFNESHVATCCLGPIEGEENFEAELTVTSCARQLVPHTTLVNYNGKMHRLTVVTYKECDKQ